MNSTDSVTISTSYWRVPSVEHAFDGWLEGRPTEEERREVIERTITKRKAWKPSPEAFEQVEQMKAFVGYKIRIQLWDPCMLMLEEEAPFPAEADCVGVTVLTDGEFPQAYLLLENMIEIPTPDGYSPAGYFHKREDSVSLLAPLADLYQVSKVVTP